MQASRSLPTCTASTRCSSKVRTPSCSHPRLHAPAPTSPPPALAALPAPPPSSLQRQRTSLLSGPPEGCHPPSPSDTTLGDWPSESCSWVPAAAVRTMTAAARVARVGGIGSDTYLVEMRHAAAPGDSDQDYATSNQSENVHLGGVGGGGGGAGDGGPGAVDLGGRGEGSVGSGAAAEGNAASGRALLMGDGGGGGGGGGGTAATVVEARVKAGAHGDSSTPLQRRCSQRLRYPKSFVRVWPPEERSLRCTDSADDDTLLDAWSDALALEEPPSQEEEEEAGAAPATTTTTTKTTAAQQQPHHYHPHHPHHQRHRHHQQHARITTAPAAPASHSQLQQQQQQQQRTPRRSTPTLANVSAVDGVPATRGFSSPPLYPQGPGPGANTRPFASLCSLWENPALFCRTVDGGGGGSGSTTASTSECTGMEAGEVPAQPLQQWLHSARRTLRDASEALAVLGAAFSYEAQRLMGGVSARLERGAAVAAAQMAAQEQQQQEQQEQAEAAEAPEHSQLREDLLRKELRQLRVVLESQQKVLQAKDDLLSSLGKMAATERNITCGMMQLHIGTDERLERWARNGRRCRLLRRSLGALRSAARQGGRGRGDAAGSDEVLPALEAASRVEPEPLQRPPPPTPHSTSQSSFSAASSGASSSGASSWRADDGQPTPADDGQPLFQSDEGSAAHGMLLAATWAAAALVAAAANTQTDEQQQLQMQRCQPSETRGLLAPGGVPVDGGCVVAAKPPTPATPRDESLGDAGSAGAAEDMRGSRSPPPPPPLDGAACGRGGGGEGGGEDVPGRAEARDARTAYGVRSGLKALNFQPLRVIHLSRDGRRPPCVTCYPGADLRPGSPSQPPPSPVTHPLLLSSTGAPNYYTTRGRRRKDTWMAHVLVPVRRVSLPRNSTVAQQSARPKRPPCTRQPPTHSSGPAPTTRSFPSQQQQHVSSYFPAVPSRQH